MATGPVHAPPQGDPYPGSAVLAAGIATLFFPVISLIVALLLLSAERGPTRRASLRTWAWVSVGWIVVQVLFVVLFLVGVSGGSDSGGGGPAIPVESP